MAKQKVDLRKSEWREAIVKIAEAVEGSPLTNRALALLLRDSTGVTFSEIMAVLKAIPKLPEKYLK